MEDRIKHVRALSEEYVGTTASNQLDAIVNELKEIERKLDVVDEQIDVLEGMLSE